MRKALLFAAIIATLGALGGCTETSENGASTGPKVAYSSVGDSNSWFLAFSAELEKEAKQRGYDFRVTHAQAKLEKQIADVEDIVAQKPDFLILGPIDRDGSADALRIAKEAGVPVVVVNRDIKGVAGEDYITKIYSDFEWIGEKMAELIHDAFGADAEVIRVVELHGTKGSGNTIGMSKGFRKKMAEYPNMTIVASQPGDFNRATAMKSMENIIQSGVEFDAVFGHFDEDALGAIRALRASGRKLGSNPREGEIVVVGNGGTKAGLAAIQAGHYHKIVSVTPYYADQVFDAIEAYLKNETLPTYIRVEDIIIDKSNVDEHMPTAF
ncbi:MAG: ABC transporter substrate-binding protein [Thermoguttaceae bacterium]